MPAPSVTPAQLMGDLALAEAYLAQRVRPTAAWRLFAAENIMASHMHLYTLVLCMCIVQYCHIYAQL